MIRKKLMLLVFAAALLAGCDFIAGNFVWDDLDQDGIQDPGEPGLEGITVFLYKEIAGEFIAGPSTTTDSMGMYSFEISRDEDTYQLGFQLPSSYEFSPQNVGDDISDSDADPVTGRSQQFNINSDPLSFTSDETIDAGMHLIPEESEYLEIGFSIGDFVWQDINFDGIQDEDEAGVEGVQVELVEVGSGNSSNATTDALGNFEFTDLLPGDYQLAFTAPSGFDFTLMDEGTDDSKDSDADPGSGQTAVFTLVDGDNFDMDAGIIEQEDPEDGSGGGEPLAYCVGPELADFPDAYSPLTGQMVADPTLLSLRPVFLSMSLFPPSVRPPQGLSVAPIAYQFYIGEGDTRMLVGFHGEYPAIETEFELGDFDLVQDSPPFEIAENDYAVGNWVWFDSNGNSLQDPGEPGFPNINVSLYVNGSLVDSTVSDGNGQYWLSATASAGDTYRVKFELPSDLSGTYSFVEQNATDNEFVDSDANIVTGWTGTFSFGEGDQTIFKVDAGIRRVVRIEGVRSGRVFFEDIRQQFCGCVITAGADPTVAAQIQTCGFAASSDTGDIGASGVDIVQLGNIAQQNSEGNACANPNLSGNLFCTEIELQSSPGQELFTFWNVNNRDHFVYNAEMGAYSWAKNLPSDNENFVVLTDGLNGETLYFENVVVMLTTMTQENAAGTIFEMDLQHTTGEAFIFRNGQMYPATWSTIGGEYEQSTGLLRPYRFLDANGNPFPFAPGQTFVQMLHTFHLFEETSPGIWRARFYAPVYSP